MNKYYGDVERTISEFEQTYDVSCSVSTEYVVELEGKKDIWVCNVCGGKNIEKKSWVDVNTHEFIEDAITEDDDGDIYCRDCYEYSGMVKEHEFEKPEEEKDEPF